MLPHFVWQDFRDVMRDMRDAGFALQDRLVRAALRVPLSALGDVERAGVELELRQAIEPWHVLGEEGARRHGALRRFVARTAAGA